LSQTASGVEQAGHEGIWFIEDELGMAKGGGPDRSFRECDEHLVKHVRYSLMWRA